MSNKPTFEAWLRGSGYKVKPCNCGGPQYGTDCSPDCEREVSAMDLQDLYDDEMYERFELEDGHDEGMAMGGDAYNDCMFGESPDF